MAIRDKALDAAQAAQNDQPDRAADELDRALEAAPEQAGDSKLQARMDKHEAAIARLQAQLDAVKADMLGKQSAAEARADTVDEQAAEAQQHPAARLDPPFVERVAEAVGVLPNQVFDVKHEQDGRVRVITADARKLLSKGAVK